MKDKKNRLITLAICLASTWLILTIYAVSHANLDMINTVKSASYYLKAWIFLIIYLSVIVAFALVLSTLDKMES